MIKRIFLLAFVLLFAGLIIFTWYRFRDRHPGYEVAIEHFSPGPEQLTAGFGKASINPLLTDTWVDVNGDAKYIPEDGDTYQDVNKNGKFDAIWIAGFHKKRAAQGINDTIWARSFVLDQGGFRLGVCVIDAVGFGADDIIDIRKEVANKSNLDYLVVASTHSHQTPDLIGMWGETDYSNGVNPDYLKLVKEQCLNSILEAEGNLRPAGYRYAEDLTVAENLVSDSRKPEVLDPGLRIMQFIDLQSGATMGSILGWANHPETLWSKNTLVSSDFPHYMRQAVEKGIYEGDSLFVDGIGGVSVYMNGAIGGLMTTSPRSAIMSLQGDTAYLEASYDKAKAQGETLAFLSLQLLAEADTQLTTNVDLHVIAKSVRLPMSNNLFKLANLLGVLDRGTVGWFKVRSEVAYWQLGDIGFLNVPGEIYPEIVNGGIESPEGQDFKTAPIEIPPLRELLPTKHTFVVGLSNDMIGYIIPKSEWDEKEPYLYHDHSSPYGEINSMGPETAPVLHKEILEMMRDFESGLK